MFFKKNTFNKEKFIKENTINKFPFEKKEGLFISELTIKEKFLIENKLIENAISVEDKKLKVTDESYFDSICLRVSLGLVDADGNKVFTLEEIKKLKDKEFVESANEKILEVNKVKK